MTSRRLLPRPCEGGGDLRTAVGLPPTGLTRGACAPFRGEPEGAATGTHLKLARMPPRPRLPLSRGDGRSGQNPGVTRGKAGKRVAANDHPIALIERDIDAD